MLWRNSTYVFMTLGFVAYTFALGGLAGWMPAFLERYNGMNAVILNCVPAAIRATAMAVNIFLIHALGDVISPPIIGILSDHFGLFPATLAAPAMMVVSGAILLYAIRSYRGGGTRWHRRRTYSFSGPA